MNIRIKEKTTVKDTHQKSQAKSSSIEEQSNASKLKKTSQHESSGKDVSAIIEVNSKSSNDKVEVKEQRLSDLQTVLSTVQQADSNAKEIEEVLGNMLELVQKSSEGNISDRQRASMQSVINGLIKDVEFLASNAAFDNIKKLGETFVDNERTDASEENKNANSADQISSLDGLEVLPKDIECDIELIFTDKNGDEHSYFITVVGDGNKSIGELIAEAITLDSNALPNANGDIPSVETVAAAQALLKNFNVNMVDGKLTFTPITEDVLANSIEIIVDKVITIEDTVSADFDGVGSNKFDISSMRGVIDGRVKTPLITKQSNKTMPETDFQSSEKINSKIYKKNAMQETGKANTHSLATNPKAFERAIGKVKWQTPPEIVVTAPLKTADLTGVIGGKAMKSKAVNIPQSVWIADEHMTADDIEGKRVNISIAYINSKGNEFIYSDTIPNDYSGKESFIDALITKLEQSQPNSLGFRNQEVKNQEVKDLEVKDQEVSSLEFKSQGDKSNGKLDVAFSEKFVIYENNQDFLGTAPKGDGTFSEIFAPFKNNEGFLGFVSKGSEVHQITDISYTSASGTKDYLKGKTIIKDAITLQISIDSEKGISPGDSIKVFNKAYTMSSKSVSNHTAQEFTKLSELTTLSKKEGLFQEASPLLSNYKDGISLSMIPLPKSGGASYSRGALYIGGLQGEGRSVTTTESIDSIFRSETTYSLRVGILKKSNVKPTFEDIKFTAGPSKEFTVYSINNMFSQTNSSVIASIEEDDKLKITTFNGRTAAFIQKGVVVEGRKIGGKTSMFFGKEGWATDWRAFVAMPAGSSTKTDITLSHARNGEVNFDDTVISYMSKIDFVENAVAIASAINRNTPLKAECSTTGMLNIVSISENGKGAVSTLTLSETVENLTDIAATLSLLSGNTNEGFE